LARRGPTRIARGVIAAPAREGGLVVARLPLPEGAARRAVIRAVLLLLGALAVSLALVYPLSRSITRPLEKLTSVVEAYGRGDLSRRSGLGDLHDEVGRLARSFDEMADRIQAARKAERELLANVSHELRTPLARIQVALELLDARDEASKKRIDGIHQEIEELDRLVGDILTASKLNLASLPLQRRELKLIEMAEKARRRAQALEPARPIELDVPAELQLPADEALLAPVRDNLIDHARKHDR